MLQIKQEVFESDPNQSCFCLKFDISMTLITRYVEPSERNIELNFNNAGSFLQNVNVKIIKLN